MTAIGFLEPDLASETNIQPYIWSGSGRLDYTKGIGAIPRWERFLEAHPSFRGRFTSFNPAPPGPASTASGHHRRS